MKKLMSVVISLFVGVIFTGCFLSNTEIYPNRRLIKETDDVKVYVIRTDLSGLYVDIENIGEEAVTILWDESRLNDSEITRKTLPLNEDIKEKATVLESKEIINVALHRTEDFYYLDPVLYQPGGIRIKPLKYPADLVLKVKNATSTEEIVISVDNTLMNNVEANDKYKDSTVNRATDEANDKFKYDSSEDVKYRTANGEYDKRFDDNNDYDQRYWNWYNGKVVEDATNTWN